MKTTPQNFQISRLGSSARSQLILTVLARAISSGDYFLPRALCQHSDMIFINVQMRKSVRFVISAGIENNFIRSKWRFVDYGQKDDEVRCMSSWLVTPQRNG